MLAVYLRKSRERKNEKSLKEQRLLGTEFAQSSGRPYRIYNEGIVSGTGKYERPEFQKLMEDIRSGTVTGLFVWETSRLARDETSWHELAVLLKSENVLLYDNGVEVDFNDENSYLFYTIKSGMDAHFARVTAKKIRAVLHRNAREGKVNGLQAYGYYLDEDGRPKIDSDKAEVVKKIFDMYIGGTGHYAIADYLNENRLGDKKWTYGTVRSMLLNETYTGKGKYGDIEVKYPAIVTKKTFDRAMRTRKGRGRLGKRSHSLLLGDVLSCGVCGNRYAPEIRNQRDYYTCSSRYLSDTEKCENGYVRAEYVDKIVFERILLGGSLYIDVRKAYEGGGTEERKKELENRISYLKEKIEELEPQRHRNYEAYTKGEAKPEMYRAQQERIESENAKLDEGVDSATEELEKLREGSRTLIGIEKDLLPGHSYEDRIKDLAEYYAVRRIERDFIDKGMTIMEKQDLVNKYIKRVTVNSSKKSKDPSIVEDRI